ncbi:unnamed protein product [Camellia sinensis]
MQHIPNTIEDQLILKAIKEECPWVSLPKRLQAVLNSKEEWHRSLFSYHLAEYVCRVMRVLPFRYYCDMIFKVVKNEQPHDSIPNFSAADALSKKIMWKLNKSIAKELLPIQPVDFVIEPWWGVGLVNFTLEEFKKLSEEEMATIDKVCKEEANSLILFDPEIVKGLFRGGLIYFDVPVYPDDSFKE